MPVQPDPQPISAWPHQANIPTEGMFVTVQIQSDGTTPIEEMDATLQSLIDFLQDWPGKLPNSDVTGSKYDTLLYTITPTNPINPPVQPQPGA